MKHSVQLRILALLLIVALFLPLCAFAKGRGREELITINMDEVQNPDFEEKSYFQARWIQITATIDGTHDVTVKVVRDDNHKPDAKDRVVYSNVKKKVSGQYVSPEIFLKFTSTSIEPYRIDLLLDNQLVKSANIHRMLLNLNGNTACLRGVRFRDINAAKTDKWFTFRPMNLHSVKDGTEIDIVGSNMYLIGKLIIYRDGDNIMFEVKNYDELGLGKIADLGDEYEEETHLHHKIISDHQIQFSDVRIGLYHKFADIADVARAAISKQIVLGRTYNLKKIGANGNVIVYLNGRVSYNPNGLPRVNATQNKGALMKLLDSFAY